jgi:hypothetical protein
MRVRSNCPVSAGLIRKYVESSNRAAHALGHVDEGSVTEHGRVQGREKVVGIRDYRPEVFLNQFWMLLNRFREGAEDHSSSASLALNVVATETLSNTASTATPASIFCSARGIPSFSLVRRISGSSSSRLFSAVLRLGAD